MEAGAVVAEESILGGEPEETIVVLFQTEDIKVSQPLVLSVVAEGELLPHDRATCDGQSKQEAYKCKGAHAGGEQNWPPVCRLTYRLTAHRDHLRSVSA